MSQNISTAGTNSILTEKEQIIYNKHLICYRKIKGEPFKLRKDFSKMDESIVAYLQKLSKFFNNYPNINIDDFFEAPYRVFEETDTYYDLEFYTKQKALKCYTQYIKNLEIQNPDSDDSLQRLVRSLKFVYEYCDKHNISLKEYETHIDGTMPCFVSHLKSHNINYYTLHALTFKKPDIESRILSFIFPDFYETFQKTKNKYFHSTKMKSLAEKAVQKINSNLSKT